jgi:FlaA1/EpsC-like NDP-sugar epimerase
VDPGLPSGKSVEQELLGTRLYRIVRMLFILGVYTVGLAVGLWLAYQLRFDFDISTKENQRLLNFSLWVIPMKLVLLLLIGQFSGLLSYFSIPDLRRLVLGLATSSAILSYLWLFSNGELAPPRSVILADFLLSLLAISAIRIFLRLVRERYFSLPTRHRGRVQRVGIVGAGYAGSTLVRELFVKRHLGLQPVCFFDDDPQKWNGRIHDIPVAGPPESLLSAKKKVKLDKVIIAMPSAPAKRIREIVHILQQAGLKFETVPTLDQMATGKVKVTQLRPVQIEDLLGREPVKLETEDIRGILAGQVVMVTGAGGSIGSELCRQIAEFGPKRLLLVEQSEVQMFQIEQELVRLGYKDRIVTLVADILDYPRMSFIFRRYQPQVVFHAAAHKHVPMMESHPSEAIKNNAIGTAQLAEMAVEHNVKRFVLISTDKAINPTSVMGATKRLAETYLQSLAAGNGHRTKFMAVRFGNVLGSSGSVIPTFNQQIAAGGPITVTHPEVTRYFMTIPEAVGLVLQSAAQGQGGEIFVLDMGKPVKIIDLARQLIELSGLQPDVDIEIKIVGLRPGEKLYEELHHTSEDCVATQHPSITRFICTPVPLKTIQGHLAALNENLYSAEPEQLKLLLRHAVPEYNPCLKESELPRHAPVKEHGLEPVQAGA